MDIARQYFPGYCAITFNQYLNSEYPNPNIDIKKMLSNQYLSGY